MRKKTFLSGCLLAAAALIGLDQLFKYLAQRFLRPVHSVQLLPGILHLEYRENRGAAFSILQGQTVLLVGVTSVVLIFLLACLLWGKARAKPLTAALSLVVAGGFGNLIDRVLRGYVVDYIYFVPIDFPVFNLADCCVVTGTGLMLLYLLVLEPRREKAAALAAAAGEEEAVKAPGPALNGGPLAQPAAGDAREAPSYPAAKGAGTAPAPYAAGNEGATPAPPAAEDTGTILGHPVTGDEGEADG